MGKITANIKSIGHYVPDYVLTNAELEKMVDTNNEWIMERCGIAERRILKDKTKATAFMGAEAAKKAMQKANCDPMEIELVITCTATPEHQFPATSNIIANMIGAKNAFSFDLLAACSGFIYAITTASKFIETGTHKKILVVGSDKMSSIIDYKDRNTCVLFGDGAGAVLLEADEEGYGIIDSRLYSDGAHFKNLHQVAGGSLNPATEETVKARQHFVYMEGKNVFKVAVSKMAEVAEEMMQRNNLRSEDIAWLVPHQANKRIIEATAERMNLSMDKVVLNIDKYGNTTCGSIPIGLAEIEHTLKRNDNLILCSFGAGFTWGGVYVKWKGELKS